MTIRFSQLSTVWGADDANSMLQLLDELRDALWETYGEQICQLRRDNQLLYHNKNPQQIDLWGFEDDDVL